MVRRANHLDVRISRSPIEGEHVHQRPIRRDYDLVAYGLGVRGSPKNCVRGLPGYTAVSRSGEIGGPIVQTVIQTVPGIVSEIGIVRIGGNRLLVVKDIA